MYPHVKRNGTALVFQTAALTSVGLLVVGILVHSIMRPDAIVAGAPVAETSTTISQPGAP